ncbi:MAG: hypothetical protein DRI37_04340 [Chloroflexi bacterium]|nr:MAG: hypothetical protein DRI37_04340 [Chloroflexota bacterium]
MTNQSLREPLLVDQPPLNHPLEVTAAEPAASYVTDQLVRAVADITQAAYRWDAVGCRTAAVQIDALITLHAALVDYTATALSLPVYLTSASFLARAFRVLARKRHETIVYVTGPEMGGNLFVLTRLLPLKLAQRGIAHARADLKHQVRVLTALEEAGVRLLGMFHSHPGSGPEATAPSLTDLRTQESMEQGGYVTVGAIFSRDGYIRFFSHQRPFHVHVAGNGITQIEENLFQLDLGRIRTRGGDTRERSDCPFPECSEPG